MGVPGQDIAIYSKVESSYTIEFYNQKHEKKETYQSDGYMKVIDSDTSSTGEGSDELWGIEGIEFADGFVGFEKKEALIDLDGDGLPDVGSKSGTTGSDTLTAEKWMRKCQVERVMILFLALKAPTLWKVAKAMTFS